MLSVLNVADICVNPDKPIRMNDLSTMNKIMEYMALKKPIVQYDLSEGRFSAQEASLYARHDDTVDFADKIMWLADNPEARQQMGEFGYERVVTKLSWDHERIKLLRFYNQVINPAFGMVLAEQPAETSLEPIALLPATLSYERD